MVVDLQDVCTEQRPTSRKLSTLWKNVPLLLWFPLTRNFATMAMEQQQW